MPKCYFNKTPELVFYENKNQLLKHCGIDWKARGNSLGKSPKFGLAAKFTIRIYEVIRRLRNYLLKENAGCKKN